MRQYNNGTVIQPGQYDDLRFSATATRVNPATSKPDYGTFRGNTNALLFDPTSNEGVTFQVQLPHGADHQYLELHLHWSPMTAPTDAQTVIWRAEYTLAQINEVFPAPVTLGPGTHTFSSNSQYQHIYTEIGTIDVSSWDSVSGMFSVYLYRDAASDTYTGEAAVHEIDMHYTFDQPGSRQEFVK